MAKLTKSSFPKGKQIRSIRSGLLTEGDLDLFSGVKSIEKKCRINTLPGKNTGRRGKESEYSEQKSAKQALKRYYGLLDKPFKRVYAKASNMSGSTSDNILTLLESRLDNVVYRAGLAVTRAEAKQLISHGHIELNGTRVKVPSIIVSKGDVVTIPERFSEHLRIKNALEVSAQRETTQWLSIETDKLEVTIQQQPFIESLKTMFKVNLVVELYSK